MTRALCRHCHNPVTSSHCVWLHLCKACYLHMSLSWWRLRTSGGNVALVWRSIAKRGVCSVCDDTLRTPTGMPCPLCVAS